jgi:regulator of sirC expression with transglutaminase-like and TPR domain
LTEARTTTRSQFAALASAPDDVLDLAHASLLIAKEEYPELDVVGYLARLDALAATLRARLEDLRAAALVSALNHLLFVEHTFRGNSDDYYDPRNSYLNEVLDRRVGIPITLSALYMEVGRRAGLDVQGVGLPGHFIVRVSDGSGALLVDPFHQGRVLTESDCQKRLDRIYAGKVTLEPDLLASCTHKAILARTLRNLKTIYVKAEDYPRALKIVELLQLLCPELPEEIRDRGLIHAALDCYALAAQDLEAYVARVPESPETLALRQKIEEMRRQAARLN